MKFTMTTLSDYVKEICASLDRVAHGDLTQDFKTITDFLGDFASIKQSFVLILSNFNETLVKIQEVSQQVDLNGLVNKCKEAMAFDKKSAVAFFLYVEKMVYVDDDILY